MIHEMGDDSTCVDEGVRRETVFFGEMRLTFMYSLIPAQSGNPGMRSWQKSTNALFAAMTTGVVGHRVSSRSNVMTSTLDGPVALRAETARGHREECRVTMRARDDDARAALTGALSVAAMGARLGVSWSPSGKKALSGELPVGHALFFKIETGKRRSNVTTGRLQPSLAPSCDVAADDTHHHHSSARERCCSAPRRTPRP